VYFIAENLIELLIAENVIESKDRESSVIQTGSILGVH
jgi:hypothetical protein